MDAKPITLKKTARLAGLFYFIWVLTAMYGLVYVPSKTMVKGDALATSTKILANEFLFRTGIVNDLISIVVGIFLVMTLYRLFRNVDSYLSKIMVVLLFVTFPAAFMVDAFSIASLMILKGNVLRSFVPEQRQEFVMFLFKLGDYASMTLELFWGLWLLPFGQLVYKSRFFPRILGVFLIINGISYVIHCFTSLLFPDYEAIVRQISTPLWVLGEITITLWLLIIGVKMQTLKIKRKPNSVDID